MEYQNFVRFVAVVTMLSGLAICTTAFMNTSMSEVWYVVSAYFMGACIIATGVILFITAKFEEVK